MRHPGKSDGALVEDLARVDLGCIALRAVRQRNALAENEAADLGVRAVRELRLPGRRRQTVPEAVRAGFYAS